MRLEGMKIWHAKVGAQLWGVNCTRLQFTMLHLAPTLMKVWAYANTHGKEERWGRERGENMSEITKR